MLLLPLVRLCQGEMCLAWLLLSPGSAKGCHTEAGGSSFKHCGFQKCTLQFKDAAATLIVITVIIGEREKHSLGSRIEKPDVMALQMSGCPGLAKEGVSVHLPKHGLLRECIFSCT